MKQHILRLLIVLVLVTGVGLILFFTLRDNTPFVVENFVYAENQKIEDIEEKFEDLNSKIDAKFSENKVIFDSFKQSVDYYVTILNNSKLNKEQVNEIKSIYKQFNEESDTIRFSLENVEKYLALSGSEQNAHELAGRKSKVNADFKKLNQAFYVLVETFENIALENIYNGTNLNVYASILSCKNIMNNCYLETENHFAFISSVNVRLNTLKNYEYKVSSEAVKFSIKYNETDKNVWKTDFYNYFATNTVTNDLNILLNFLNSGGYYEKT